MDTSPTEAEARPKARTEGSSPFAIFILYVLGSRDVKESCPQAHIAFPSLFSQARAATVTWEAERGTRLWLKQTGTGLNPQPSSQVFVPSCVLMV